MGKRKKKKPSKAARDRVQMVQCGLMHPEIARSLYLFVACLYQGASPEDAFAWIDWPEAGEPATEQGVRHGR